MFKSLRLTKLRLEPYDLLGGSASGKANSTGGKGPTLSLTLCGPKQRDTEISDASNQRTALQGKLPYAAQFGTGTHGVTLAGGAVSVKPGARFVVNGKATKLEACPSPTASLLANGSTAVGERQNKAMHGWRPVHSRAATS
jgi:hypothetical protein